MTDKSYIRNEEDISVARDGSCVLYQRTDPRNGNVREIYQCRVRLPSTSKQVRFSTKTKDKNQAIRFALERYEDFYQKSKKGEPIQSIGTKRALKEFSEWFETSREVRIVERNRDHYIKVINKYPYEFFVGVCNDIPVDKIDDNLIQDYFNYRRENHNISNNTLRREMTIFAAFLDFCVRKKNYLPERPYYKLPDKELNRRPAWTNSEYRKIYSKMRIWVKEDPNGRVRRQRFYIQQMILLMSNSGLRPDEFMRLKWKHFSQYRYSDGTRLVADFEEGKTGGRKVIFNKGSEEYLDRLYDHRKSELTKDPDLDEWIFCHEDGTKIGKINKGFNSLMDFCGTKENAKGEKYTPYSCRHFYATQRLLKKTPVIDVALNMGTSVEMIQKFYIDRDNILRGESVTQDETRSASGSTEKEYPYRTA